MQKTISTFMTSTAALVLLVLVPTAAFAQLPAARLDGVFPAGAQAGTTLEVTLAGNDLDDALQLHFSHPGITAKPKMTAADAFHKQPQVVPNQFEVTVAGNVPIGAYDVRVKGKYGLSNPRTFDVGSLAELTEAEPNNEFEEAIEVTLPQVVNGQINGNTDVDLFRFTAQAGQRLLLDCRARRIDSPLDAVLGVYDGKGRELITNRDGYAREPLIDFRVPAAGEYYVRVTDAFYRGSPSHVYRLAIGELPHIDYVFPPAGAAGSNNQYTVYGRNLPGGQTTDQTVDGQPLEKLTVNVALPDDPASALRRDARVDPEQAFLDAIDYRVQHSSLLSNPIGVGVATAAVVIEAEPNNSPQQSQPLSPPCEVASQFYPQRDDDWYSFEAQQGDSYMIEVISDRLGLPTDPLLVIQQVTRNEAGEEQIKLLATSDDLGNRDRAQFDTRNGDTRYKFEAPADATYRIKVREGYSALRSDPRLVYRLAIRKLQPDFRLVAVPRDPWGALVLRRGDRTTIDVLADRRDDLAQPIVVSVTGLPAGVTSSEVTLGPAMNVATLVLSAGDNAAAAVANLEIIGKAKIDGRDVTRTARCGTANMAMNMLQPNQQPQNSLPARVCRQLVLSVTEEVSPLAVQLKNDQVWETTRAGILKVPYTAVRRNDYKGQVQCEVENLPANVNRTNFTIAANNASGEFQLTLRNNTPAGIYTLHAGAFVTGYSYARNPEAAEAAKQHKEEIDKIAADADKAVKEAATAKQQADKESTDATNAAKAAEQTLAQVMKAETDALALQKAADDSLEKAKAAAAAGPDDANLKNAVTAAEKGAADAAAKAKAAAEATAAATKTVEETAAKATEAAEKKVAADKAAEEAAEFAKQAAEEKKAADKLATDTANAAKPKNINYWTASTPITIKIHEYPITLAALPEATKLKQGDKTEVPITVTRLVDYADQVSFTTVVSGVGGLTIQNVNLPKDQTQIMLPITAAANATPGKHQITLRATMRVNNQTLTLDQPFALEIEQVEAQPTQ